MSILIILTVPLSSLKSSWAHGFRVRRGISIVYYRAGKLALSPSRFLLSFPPSFSVPLILSLSPSLSVLDARVPRNTQTPFSEIAICFMVARNIYRA